MVLHLPVPHDRTFTECFLGFLHDIWDTPLAGIPLVWGLLSAVYQRARTRVSFNLRDHDEQRV